ncbi:MAG TPA: phosphatidylglycerophosphatase A [Verrucomicrobiae bacterium]|jgi:phosphatidylglycerophosphatase A|nr:phosphatidylglycerophosphatase A [Verrucomicrobiae bacterium]
MKLWIAQGLGAGRAPVAPGTFGSVVGVGWFFLLLSSHSWIWFVIGNIAAFALSVWLCGEGEKILQKRDPGSVVLDEIAAMPLCFTVWMLAAATPRDWPGFFARYWPGTLIVFALFRLFDVWKPWPVRQSQALPGGWGVTIDDTLAAVYVNVVMGAGLIFLGVLSR